MLTIATRLKVITFIVLAGVVLVFTGVKYAALGPLVGFRDYYVVKLELPRTGGLYENSAVTYRGVNVGKVGEIHLTAGGVVADLQIQDGVTVPASTQAHVLNLSAVGEQYVDLRPTVSTGATLREGSVIPKRVTTTPTPVTQLLTSVSDLAGSVPLNDLSTLVDELGDAFEGQGPNLQVLLDEGGDYITTADANITPTTELIYDGNVVLRTQNEMSDEIKTFARTARQFSGALRDADGDLRQLIKAAPQASTEVSGLLRDLDPSFAVLVANLLTTADLTRTRVNGLEELMVHLPATVSIGKTALSGGKFHFGTATTFFNPLPCVSGYQGTTYRGGTNTSPGKGLNTAAKCALPARSGVNVRGSANAPKGGVPDAVRPGGFTDSNNADMAGALGLPSLPQSGPVDMTSLLGVEEMR